QYQPIRNYHDAGNPGRQGMDEHPDVERQRGHPQVQLTGVGGPAQERTQEADHPGIMSGVRPPSPPPHGGADLPARGRSGARSGGQAELMTSIDVKDLTKEYGTRRAVDHLTFRVRPGRV